MIRGPSPTAGTARGARDEGPMSHERAQADATDGFHAHYYYSSTTWLSNTFLGVRILQCPFDMYLYQELIVRTRPSCIVQTGVLHGGSVLYFATLLDLIGAPPDAPVVGVDVALGEEARSLSHPRIRLVEGDSVGEAMQEVRSILRGRRGLVSLDSDHREAHVFAELMAYREFVDVGSYLVAEDTNINGHPVLPGYGPGPMEAVERFLEEDDRFARDDALWERNLLSFHAYGWLRRVRD